uniref:VWFA domain-containing protein n=1 Tax=Rhabditophanes sp. KR3021 TaxID=114890 RepID=A0AC35TP76_9BILA
MITYQLDPKLTDNLPVFDIRAQSSMASNAAIASTTTTILPTTLPRAIDSKLLQSDIAIILDTSSQDNALLQKTATDIISALTIDTVLPNLYSRVNLMLLGENSATVTGWTLPKAILLASIKIATRIDKKASITIPNFVNPFEGAFQQSVMERPNVQRIAIFITDNNLQHGDPGTRLKGNQVVKQNDIHSILVSINPTLKAETDFSTISKAFTGVNSNELIAHDFVSKDNLFENVLLNGNVLCNFGSIIKSSNQDSAFTFPFQNEDAPFITNYCNNMHFSFKCANENDLLPISVAMTHYSLELDKDYVQIYDDTDSTDPEAVFNGIHDSNTINSIQSYFINFKITTDFNGVFKGFNAAFTNCKILA